MYLPFQRCLFVSRQQKRPSSSSSSPPPPSLLSIHRSFLPVAFVVSILPILAIATCPTCKGFEEYVLGLDESWFGTTVNWIISKFGLGCSCNGFWCNAEFQRASYLGVFGFFIPLPSLRYSPCEASTGGVAYLFILVNFLCYLVLRWLPSWVHYNHFLASTSNIKRWRIWCLITSNISHGSLVHLMGNMVGIATLGPVLQSFIGCHRFVELLLFAATISSLMTVLFGLLHKEFQLGSCGASGILTAFQTASYWISPRASLWAFHGHLSHLQLFCFHLAFQLLAGSTLVDVPGHLGGFFAAMLFVQYRF